LEKSILKSKFSDIISFMVKILISILLLVPTLSAAAVPTGREVVDRMDRLLRGETTVGLYEMEITTPTWSRTLRLRAWEKGREKTFIRILAPAREEGNATLRRSFEMWNYLDNIERVIKIPPSMMLLSWMGSDFTNDDLVKESSIVNDYEHTNRGVVDVDGQKAYLVEAVPREDAPVVWGKVVLRVRTGDYVPLSEEFYSEHGELVRVLTFSEIRRMGGRTIPARWEMVPLKKEGHSTVFRILEIAFDQKVDDGIFTLRNLKGFGEKAGRP